MLFKKRSPDFYYFLYNLNQNQFLVAFSVNCRAKSDLLLQMEQIKPYKPKHKIRIVTAASLFDGHDAAINIMRRIIQATGVEVIHLGHDRSVAEVVDCSIQEDANAIAMERLQMLPWCL